VEKWQFATGGEIVSSPAIGSDGTIYVGSKDTNVYAVDPNTGTSKWARSIGGEVVSSPAIGWDGTIYIGSPDNSLYALDPNTGNVQWTFATGGIIESSPSIGSDGSIYFGSNDGSVYALYPDGKLKWANSSPGVSVTCSPAVLYNGAIYVTAGNGIFMLSASDGTELAYNSLSNSISTSPIITSSSDLVVGSDDGYLYLLNSAGIAKYQYLAGAPIVSTPAMGMYNTTYFGMNNGNLTAVTLDPNTFSFQWTDSLGGTLRSSPAIGSDGTVYVGSENGKLYALLAHEPTASLAAWPMFRHDPQRTGRAGIHTPPPVIGTPSTSGYMQTMMPSDWGISCDVTPAGTDAVIDSVYLDLTNLDMEPISLTNTSGNTWERPLSSINIPFTVSAGPTTIDIIAIDDQGAQSRRTVNVNVLSYP